MAKAEQVKISVRLDSETYRKLDAQRMRDDRSMSTTAARILKEAVKSVK